MPLFLSELVCPTVLLYVMRPQSNCLFFITLDKWDGWSRTIENYNQHSKWTETNLIHWRWRTKKKKTTWFEVCVGKPRNVWSVYIPFSFSKHKVTQTLKWKTFEVWEVEGTFSFILISRAEFNQSLPGAFLTFVRTEINLSLKERLESSPLT